MAMYGSKQGNMIPLFFAEGDKKFGTFPKKRFFFYMKF